MQAPSRPPRAPSSRLKLPPGFATWRKRAGTAVLGLSMLGASIAACGPSGSAPGTSGSTTPGASAVGLSTPPLPGKPPGGVREGSTVAVADEGDVVFVADEDHSALDVVTLPVGYESKPLRVETPGRPAQIAVVGKKVLVTIREMPDKSGALIVYERQGGKGSATLSETGRATLPADAWGIAVSPDGSLAAVTSAWTAKVSLVDLPTMKVGWTRDVEREPRGAIFMADNATLYVSHIIDAPLTRIDDVRGAAKVSRVPFPPSLLRAPIGENLSASNGYALATTPDRDRIFAPRHALGTLGNNTWFGSAAVDVLDVASGKPIGTHREQNEAATFLGPFTPLAEGSQVGKWSAAASPAVTVGAQAFAEPRGAVYRKGQRTLLVVSEGDDAIVELDALMSDPTLGAVHRYGLATDSDRLLGIPAHGGAPSGIALSADESIAFVHCRSTDELAVIRLPDWQGSFVSAPPLFVKLADDSTNHDYTIGRRLFYEASNGMSGGVACAGCHPDGRDDGYIWHEVHFDRPSPRTRNEGFTNFIGSASNAKSLIAFWQDDIPGASNVDAGGAGFARQTPMLVGRLKAKGPYGWRAESADLEGRLLAGFDLHRWEWGSGPKDTTMIARARPLATFVQTGLVPPPVAQHPLTDEEQRGRDIFMSEKSQCSTCHVPESDYTNHAVAALPDGPPRAAFVSEKGAAFKVPSLLFVGGSPPYFHDGRYASLEELIEKDGDQMGKTSYLSADEKKALVAFLRTL